MTSSIPDSFNLDELSAMLETAPQEEDLHAENCSCNSCDDKQEFSPEFIDEVASEMLDLATSKCPDPLVHKVMAMKVIHNMIEWHRNVAIKQLDDGNQGSMGAWMRDAGKFQACMDILTSIMVGPDDFTCRE